MRVGDIAATIETMAPLKLAESWDNVGIQVGNSSDPVHKILVTLDVTPAVIDEAAQVGANLIVSHHPLIFSPMKQIDTGSQIGRLVGQLLCREIDLYAAHTNLDVAPGGVSDRLAEIIGLADMQPLEVTGKAVFYKLAVFVPDESVAAVRDAVCKAGAGEIGNYTWCSFTSPGTGSFYPQPGANPAVGKVGELEFVSEHKLEVIVPEKQRDEVISAMLRSHPYESVAYDLYRLENLAENRGIGRVGTLQEPGTLNEVARRTAARLASRTPKICGDPNMPIERLAICAGSGRKMVEIAARSGAQAFLAADFGHHDGLDALGFGIGLIDMGHYATERPIVETLADYLRQKLRGAEVVVSQVDTDPFYQPE